MQKTVWEKVKKKGYLPLVVIGVIVVLLAFFLYQAQQPKRSVAAYCNAYKQEKARLSKLPGDTYPSGVFDLSVGDAGQIATSFNRLERVAPTEISSDVKTLGQLYQKIHDDPSQAVAASLSGGSIDDSLKAWTQQNCRQ